MPWRQKTSAPRRCCFKDGRCQNKREREHSKAVNYTREPIINFIRPLHGSLVIDTWPARLARALLVVSKRNDAWDQRRELIIERIAWPGNHTTNKCVMISREETNERNVWKLGRRFRILSNPNRVYDEFYSIKFMPYVCSKKNLCRIINFAWRGKRGSVFHGMRETRERVSFME